MTEEVLQNRNRILDDPVYWLSLEGVAYWVIEVDSDDHPTRLHNVEGTWQVVSWGDGSSVGLSLVDPSPEYYDERKRSAVARKERHEARLREQAEERKRQLRAEFTEWAREEGLLPGEGGPVGPLRPPHATGRDMFVPV